MTDEEAQAAIKAVQEEVGKEPAGEDARGRGGQQERRRNFSGGEQEQRRRGHAAQRPAIQILKEGTGPKPTASDTVECNYRGTFINGTEF